jgi:hypothetical protein
MIAMKHFLKLKTTLMISLLYFCSPVIAYDVQAVKIKNVMGYCLDVVNNNVQLADCNERQTKRWFGATNREEAKLEYHSISDYDGRCLDVSGAINKNRTNIQMYKCNETVAQQWKFTSKGEIHNKMGKCLEVSGGVNKIGTNIQLYDCNSTKSQFWKREIY